MAFELPFDKFVSLIKDKGAKAQLSKVKLPDPAFFGDTNYKAGKGINISAKTTDTNVNYLAKLFKSKISGKNLDIDFQTSKIRFIVSSKKSVSNRNSLGKALADAGELATVVSLTKTIKKPEDTGQKIFIDDLTAFKDWQLTFDETKKVVAKELKESISQYMILHDATDTSSFKTVITSFVKKIKMSKDSWNPADIFLIKKTEFNKVVANLTKIVDNTEMSDGLVDVFNTTLYQYYKKGIVYPFSLKQLTKKPPSVDFNNVPGSNAPKHYKIEINKLNCDLSLKGKEIGLMTFKNKDTNKDISMQVRGFPHGYTTAQTEITSDGSPSGGRLGKVSTQVVDRIMERYNDERIKSISFFGKSPNTFSEFDKEKIKEVWSWYTLVKEHQKVSVTNPLSKTQFEQLVEQAKKNYETAETLCIKIQGLKILYFFVKNEKNISGIMNNMINGAKKISNDSGFFIKIY